MNIIDRYLLKRFFLTFFVSILCFVLIFDLVNLVERIGNLLESGATFADVFMYYFYFTPFIIVLTCPIATLLASIFSIGLMAKSNELLAMKAAGVSLYRIVATLVAGGILIAVGLWVFGEMILPEANSRKNIIEAEKFERRNSESATVYRNQMFQGLHGRVFQFTNYVSKSATGEDVVIQTFEGNKLKQLITADRFVWQDTIWVGSEVQVRDFGDFESDPEPIKNTKYPTLPFPDFREKPTYFEDWFSRQDPLSMNYFKLKKFIQVSRALGKDVTTQLVDLENKSRLPIYQCHHHSNRRFVGVQSPTQWTGDQLRRFDGDIVCFLHLRQDRDRIRTSGSNLPAGRRLGYERNIPSIRTDIAIQDTQMSTLRTKTTVNPYASGVETPLLTYVTTCDVIAGVLVRVVRKYRSTARNHLSGRFVLMRQPTTGVVECQWLSARRLCPRSGIGAPRYWLMRVTKDDITRIWNRQLGLLIHVFDFE